MARGALRPFTPGPPPGRRDYLSRHFRDRAVSVHLPTGTRPLGYAAGHPGVAPARRPPRPGGPPLAVALGCRRGHARAVGGGGGPPGSAGAAHSRLRGPWLSAARHGSLLRPAAGPLLVSLPHAAAGLSSPRRRTRFPPIA